MASAVAGAVALLASAAAQLSFEDMMNRPGSDYHSFDVFPPPPPGHGPRVGVGACRMACNEDYRCRAWSYDYGPIGRGFGTCFLKQDAPPAIPDVNFVSGVKPVAPVFPLVLPYELDSYRDGDLMHEFVTQKEDDKPFFCEYACLIHLDWLTGDRCRSWSWEKTPNGDHICRLFQDESGARWRPGDISGKLPG